MANALARVELVDIDTEGLWIRLYVAFSGAEVNAGVGAVDYVAVRLLPEDQPAAIRTKMSNAVSAFAQSKGWTVLGGAMTLPTFQKG